MNNRLHVNIAWHTHEVVKYIIALENIFAWYVFSFCVLRATVLWEPGFAFRSLGHVLFGAVLCAPGVRTRRDLRTF